LKPEANEQQVKTGENLLKLLKLLLKEREGKKVDLINGLRKGTSGLLCEYGNKHSGSTNNAAIQTEKLLAARESQE